MQIDADGQARLSRELAPGERLLWSGRPAGNPWLCPQDLVLLPFSVAWTSIAIIFEVAALGARSNHTSVFAVLWGIPFVALGLYLIVGRLFVRRRIRADTLYALTDRRAIVVSRSWRGGERASSIWLGSYPPVERRPQRNGTATLWIGPQGPGQRLLGGEPAWPLLGMAGGSALAFVDLHDADEVYERLRARLSE
ncbi:MAG TPA: hypothetical protein VH061_13960 [Solirubrobacteraceae bacterium]|jgi:hypothetical protein|nr:hypothetical protein [Solirubrobacteraceae bacterium]